VRPQTDFISSKRTIFFFPILCVKQAIETIYVGRSYSSREVTADLVSRY
jgi:hypothetical protein